MHIKSTHESINIIDSVNDKTEDGTFIIKVNDKLYEIVKKDTIKKVVPGWIYNGEENVNGITKLFQYP